ncbi:MAG: flagellar basal body-associated FliL family protein [Myxococcales bacterium]
MSDKPAESAAAPAKPSSMPTILAGVNLLATLGILAAILLRPAPAAAPKAEHGAEGHGEAAEAGAEGGHGGKGVGPTMKLADFVIKLRDPEAERYARLSMEMELKAEPDKEKIAPYIPRLRDAFVAYLTDRKSEELLGSEALTHTKAELLKLSSELVPNNPVRALYFTDFVIQ